MATQLLFNQLKSINQLLKDKSDDDKKVHKF